MTQRRAEAFDVYVAFQAVLEPVLIPCNVALLIIIHQTPPFMGSCHPIRNSMKNISITIAIAQVTYSSLIFNRLLYCVAECLVEPFGFALLHVLDVGGAERFFGSGGLVPHRPA